ncbi:MAG: hypothetical protein HN443_07240 [Flavobacteriaceae bacterium]|nr:hypothetical protein [Flavobacteriaceae bacterium]
MIFSLVFVKASPILPSFSFITQPTSTSDDTLNIIYQNNSLLIQGIKINGTLKIYSIIGNKIMDMNVQDFSKVFIPINLERQNLYIIRIETTDNRIFTHKIVAH